MMLKTFAFALPLLAFIATGADASLYVVKTTFLEPGTKTACGTVIGQNTIGMAFAPGRRRCQGAHNSYNPSGEGSYSIQVVS